MILAVHLLFGAAMARLGGGAFWGFGLAFLSHYFLDILPHTEYETSIVGKSWKNLKKDAIKIAADLNLGMFLALFFSGPSLQLLFSLFLSVLPDGLTLLNLFLPNKFLDAHDNFHHKKIHFLKHKKIPFFWRFFTQFAAVIFAFLVLIN